MPTAAKIIASVCIAFVAWVVSGLVKQGLGLQNTGYFVVFSVLAGAACGWIILGRRADRGRLGVTVAIGVGLTAMAMTVFWVLATVALAESFDIAMSRRFHDPFKVIYNAYPIAMRYGTALVNSTVLTWLIAGGAITGVLAHVAGRKWPGR